VKGFSPRYAAPEVFGRVMTNLKTLSIDDEMKSDVYSFAVILWQMMARKNPWANCEFLFFYFSTFSSMNLKFKFCSERGN